MVTCSEEAGADMFVQKGHSQFSVLLNFYTNQGRGMNISTVAFYKIRMNYNPNAIKFMMKDYLSMISENVDASMVKLDGCIVTAIDGRICTAFDKRKC